MQAWAQEGTISVSPLINELSIHPDGEYERTIEVTNIHSSLSYDVDVTPFDISVDPESHNVKFFAEESKGNVQRSLASWVVFDSEESFRLAPGESREVDYHLEIPQSVSSGDYYAALNFYFEAVKERNAVNGGVQVRQSIGSLLLVTLSKNANAEAPTFEDLVFSELTLSPRGDEVVVNLNMLNNLLNYLNVNPYIEITDRGGEVYFQHQGASKRVFPGESADIVHAFPESYMRSEEPLVMKYSLHSKAKAATVYESEVEIGAAPSLIMDLWGVKGVLILGTILMLGVLGFIWKRRK